MTSLVDPVNFYLINTIIYCTEILIIRCRTYTVDMRTEVTFCNASQSLVEHTIHDTSQTAILMCMYNCYLTVMISCHIQVSTIYICCKETSSHSVDIYTVDPAEITILITCEYCHTFIFDGI